MAIDHLLELLFYTLPAVVVGLVTFYFLKTWQTEEEKKRYFELRKANKDQSLPIKLQAYERMTLFLERISLGNLLLRVKPYNDEVDAYENLLISTIEQEFEHNLAQQIYLSDRAWGVIRASKNATMSIIRKTAMIESVTNSDKLRETILSDLIDRPTPTDAGLAQLKEDVKAFL